MLYTYKYYFKHHCSGFTPLHLAIVKSRNEAAKILMSELGVRGMGAVNESGITAAHVAASAGYKRLCILCNAVLTGNAYCRKRRDAKDDC